MQTEELTADQLARYGDVLVQFCSYYKYSFTFVGDLPDGRRLMVCVGSCAEDIYRMSVGTEPLKVSQLGEPELAMIYEREAADVG
jgi:hypothetical protein